MDVSLSPKVSLLAEISGNLGLKFQETQFFVGFFFVRDISTISELNNLALCDFQLRFFLKFHHYICRNHYPLLPGTKPTVCLNRGATKGFAQPLSSTRKIS